MKKSLINFLIFALIPIVAACTSVGPHPEMTTVGAEIKATKTVGRILVIPTMGTHSGDEKADINKILPAAAYERYHDHMVLSTGLGNVLQTLKMPKDLAPILAVNWEAAFYRWVQGGESDPKGDQDRDAADQDSSQDDDAAATPIKRSKSTLHLPLPHASRHIAKSEKDLQKLARSLKRHRRALAPVRAAVATGKAEEVEKAQSAAKKTLIPVENLLRHLIKRLDVTYILASYLDGNKESFAKNHVTVLHVALINVETGKFRYYTRSFGKRSDLPTSFEGLYAAMARNVFEDIAAVDKIDF